MSQVYSRSIGVSIVTFDYRGVCIYMYIYIYDTVDVLIVERKFMIFCHRWKCFEGPELFLAVQSKKKML